LPAPAARPTHLHLRIVGGGHGGAADRDFAIDAIKRRAPDASRTSVLACLRHPHSISLRGPGTRDRSLRANVRRAVAMGARSAVYAMYYIVQTVILLGLTLFMWIGITPMLPTCSSTCPVDIMAPTRTFTGSLCSAATTSTQLYAAGCYACTGFSVTWPCPSSAGCSTDETRLAQTCIGLLNASSPTGQPIVYEFYLTSVPADFARCAAVMGEPSAVSDSGVCGRCITAGRCANAALFEGAGSFLDTSGRRQLCFTVPLRIALRPVVVPGLYLFLLCYFLMTLLLGTNAAIMCSFRG
jgi:hypothetical protein